METDTEFTSCACLLSVKTETCFPDRMLLQPCNTKFIFVSVHDFKCSVCNADPRGRTVEGGGLCRLWVRILWGHGCMSVVSAVCQADVFATGRSRRVFSRVCSCVSLSVIHTV